MRPEVLPKKKLYQKGFVEGKCKGYITGYDKGRKTGYYTGLFVGFGIGAFLVEVITVIMLVLQ